MVQERDDGSLNLERFGDILGRYWGGVHSDPFIQILVECPLSVRYFPGFPFPPFEPSFYYFNHTLNPENLR